MDEKYYRQPQVKRTGTSPVAQKTTTNSICPSYYNHEQEENKPKTGRKQAKKAKTGFFNAPLENHVQPAPILTKHGIVTC